MTEKKRKGTNHGSLFYIVWSEEFSESDKEEDTLPAGESSVLGAGFSKG